MVISHLHGFVLGLKRTLHLRGRLSTSLSYSLLFLSRFEREWREQGEQRTRDLGILVMVSNLSEVFFSVFCQVCITNR